MNTPKLTPIKFYKNDLLLLMERCGQIADKIELIEKEFERELQPEMKEAFAMIHTQYKYDLAKEINGLTLWFFGTRDTSEYILGRIKGTKTFEGADISQ